MQPHLSESESVLEPKLTKADLKVLRAIPEWMSPWAPDYTKDHPISVWRVGEALKKMDLPDLLRTLNGLDNLGYVMCCGYPNAKRPLRYMRTEKGDEAVG